MRKSKNNLVTLFVLGLSITLTTTMCLAADDVDLINQDEKVKVNEIKDEEHFRDSASTIMPAPKAMSLPSDINEKMVVKEQAEAKPEALRETPGPCCDNGKNGN